MRGRFTIVLAVAAAGLAACAAGGSTVVGAAQAFPPTEGTVSGLLRVYGGPANTATGKSVLNGGPMSYSDVSIVSSTGQRSQTTSDSSGRFTFRLAPGIYRLECNESGDLAVQPGAAVEADCVLDVP